MCKSEGERAHVVLGALGEFASAVAIIEHKDLKAAAGQLALEGVALCEQQVKRCVQLLLAALRGPRAGEVAGWSDGGSARHHAVWVLHRLARRNEAARVWILEGGGVEAMHEAMLLHHQDEKLRHDGAWLAYFLDGLQGLGTLMYRSRGASQGHVEVRAGVAWAVYELIRGYKHEGAANRPESAGMLAILIDAMGQESAGEAGLQVQWACAAALDAMIKFEPRLGSLFLSWGGARLLVRSLQTAIEATHTAEKVRQSIAYLITSLADGNSQAAHVLRSEGAVGVLTEVGLNGSGQDVQATMWALGTLGGLDVLLKAMATAGSNRPAVLRGGILALSECAWNANVEPEEVACLPIALGLLLDCIAHEEVAGSNGVQDCTKALGCVLASLAPYAPPGRHHDMDRGVQALLKSLHQPNAAAGTAQAAAEGIGNIALVSPSWRAALRQCGALEGMSQWIRSSAAAGKLEQWLFWAAVAIAGLPFLAAEMRGHIESAHVVGAGLSTIVSILDDDIDGEYVQGMGNEQRGESDVLGMIMLVVKIMQVHAGDGEVLSKACRCVELLVASAPQEGLQVAAPEAVAGVLAAARRFPSNFEVVRGACAALRAFCMFSLRQDAAGGSQASSSAAAGVAAALKKEGAADCAGQAAENFNVMEAAAGREILEDAAIVLVFTQGTEGMLQRLLEAKPGSPVRAVGLKALFEVGRVDLRLLAGVRSVGITEACTKLVSEEPEEHRARMHEIASLLLGLCGSQPGARGGG